MVQPIPALVPLSDPEVEMTTENVVRTQKYWTPKTIYFIKRKFDRGVKYWDGTNWQSNHNMARSYSSQSLAAQMAATLK